MRIGKIEVRGGFILLFTLLYMIDNTGILLPLGIAALIHELGHWLALRLCGARVERMTFSFVGASMEYDGGGLSYFREIVIALAGPAASMALALGAAVWGRAYQNDWAYYLAGLSAVLGAFNLLPIRQLDGGRAVYMFLCWLLGTDPAEGILCVFTCATIFLLLLLGLGLFALSGWNFTFLAIGIWLLAGYCKIGQNSIKYARQDSNSI